MDERRLRRSRPAWLLLALSLSLGAGAACGGDGPASTPAAATPIPAMPTAATTPAPPAPPPVVPVATTAPPAPAPVRVSAPVARPNLGGDRHPMVAPHEIGRIEIPKIGLVHPIVEGIDLPQLHHGPGHWPGSAMPGQKGNVVLAGHRVTHTRPFLDIDRLVAGDEVVLTTSAGSFRYLVTGSQVVRPTDTWIVNPTKDATLTLFACHPKHSAARRYVVRARLAPPV